jgi:hypothetical protein
MTIEASHNITKAYWALGDYFSRLGGAARYRNMPESDIPLFIGCELAGILAADFNRDEYLGSEFLDAANPVIAEVLAHLSKVEAQSDELANLLVDFVSHVDGKYRPQHRSIRWERFLEWARSQTPNNSL